MSGRGICPIARSVATGVRLQSRRSLDLDGGQNSGQFAGVYSDDLTGPAGPRVSRERGHRGRTQIAAKAQPLEGFLLGLEAIVPAGWMPANEESVNGRVNVTT